MHVFKVGQRVLLTRANPLQRGSSRFTIVRCMPDDGRTGLTYRIKGDGEDHERVVPEADLEAMF